MNKIIGSVASVALLLLSVAVQAEDPYTRIVPAQPTQSVDKIEVLEVFWYGCSHCYDFEPYVKKWLATKPDDVDFRRMPGIFSKNWVPGLARLWSRTWWRPICLNGPVRNALLLAKKWRPVTTGAVFTGTLRMALACPWSTA